VAISFGEAPAVRERFRQVAGTLAEFYSELFRVQMTLTTGAPNGTPSDRDALAKISDRLKGEVEQLEGVMRGDRRKS
jgi:hypothetical protein